MVRTILVNAAPTNRKEALLSFDGLTIRAALGRSGIGILKREGDGKTPRGSLRLLYGFWRLDRVVRPVTRLPMTAIRSGDLWCDAPTHSSYNRLVRAPFKASHENMMRDDHLYDICLVMDWNVSERKRNAGSAIFLHLARPGYTPTEGCIAVSLADMRRLLSLAGPETALRIV